MKASRVLCVVCVIAVLAVLAVRWQPAASQTTATVSLEPNYIVLNTGNAAQVQVMISDVVDLYAFDVQLQFDPNFVQVDHINPGGFLDPSPFATPIIDPAGTIHYIFTQVHPSVPKSGSGALITIYLDGIHSGESEIRITSAMLSTIDGFEIPVTINPESTHINASFWLLIPLTRHLP